MSSKPTKYITYQECRQNEGWQPVKINSSSQAGVFYVVLVNPWGIDAENICECKSYVYRGSCKHQVIAHQQICRWNERDGLEVQAVSQEKSKTCPRCGGPTRIQIEVDNE